MLGHHADPRGLVYRSQSTIAEHTGFDVKTVRQALRHLEEMGLIRREARMRRDGSRSSDHIHLNMATEAVAEDKAAPTSGARALGVGTELPQGGGGAPPLTTFESFSESHLESHSGPIGPAPQGGAGRVDFQKDLFGRGFQIVQSLTGRSAVSARSLVGSWRGLAGGDCAAVLAAIDAAAEERPCEPVSWIEARLRRRRAELARDRGYGNEPRVANGAISLAMRRWGGRGAGPRRSTNGMLDLAAEMVGVPSDPADILAGFGLGSNRSRNDEAMKMALRGEWPVGGSVFVAADSPEGDAWEGHYQRLGRGTKWRPLAKGYGGMMPSAMPPGPVINMAACGTLTHNRDSNGSTTVPA